LRACRRGDAHTFVAIERESKLVLAHHVGRGRTWNDADLFVSKLAKATTGPFQLTTDGFEGYNDAVGLHLCHRADFAQLIKMYGEDPEGARRYSPGRIIGRSGRTLRAAVALAHARTTTCAACTPRSA
jgi:transposase-like protein